jgi:hypothetical protein
VALGCVPVVISDWFTFAYPWIVPYEAFVVRISESDFAKNPDYCLDKIKTEIGLNAERLAQMRRAMEAARGLLSYDAVAHGSVEHLRMLSGDRYLKPKLAERLEKLSSSSSSSSSSAGGVGVGGGGASSSSSSSGASAGGGLKTSSSSSVGTGTAAAAVGATSTASTAAASASFQTIVPLELLLLELRYAQHEYKHFNNVPCFRPYMCFHNHNGTFAPFEAAKANKQNKEKKARDYDFTPNPITIPHNSLSDGGGGSGGSGHYLQRQVLTREQVKRNVM